jgi:TolA-binding protein
VEFLRWPPVGRTGVNQGRRAVVATILSFILLTGFIGCYKSDQALLEAAEKLWLHEEYDRATDKLKLLVAEYPDSGNVSNANFRLGEINYLNLNNPNKALDYFIKVTQLEGKSELSLKSHKYIAEIYERSIGDFNLAILQYQRILNDFRDIIKVDEYMLNIGKMYYKKGSCPQAIIEYQALLTEFPNSDFALDASYHIANCLIIIGQVKAAKVIYEKALFDYPDNKYKYDIMLGIGACFEELDQLDKALLTYKKMRETFPEKKLVEKKLISINKRIKARKR